MNYVETTLLNGQVKLFQPEKGGWRATIDSVLCAAICPVKAGEHICDLGAGTGAIGLCAAFHASFDIRVTFVEIQKDYAELCLKNARENNVEASNISIDIREFKQAEKFDHVVCNPPYLKAGTHFTSPYDARQTALGGDQDSAVLEDWIACAARVLKSKGSVSMIHRADALADLLLLLKKHKFGAIEVWPVYPYAHENAHRVVVRAGLDRKTDMVMHAPLILHDRNSDNKYSKNAQTIFNGDNLLT